MAIHEVRVGIDVENESLNTLNNFGTRIFSKRIYLDQGKHHIVTAVDSFLDSFNASPSVSSAESYEELMQMGVQVIISPYPAWTGSRVGTYGPYTLKAEEENVYYKRCFMINNHYPEYPTNVLVNSQSISDDQEFPQQQLVEEEAYAFYTDQLWITVIMTAKDYNDAFEWTINRFNMSFNLQVQDLEVNPISHQMGVIREYSRAQRLPRLMNSSTAWKYNYYDGWEGQIGTLGNVGGIRSEFMYNADQLARWLGGQNPDGETMLDQPLQALVVQQAQQMTALYTGPFGSRQAPPLPSVPDWLTELPGAYNVQFALRDNFPAVVKDGPSGNTIMV
jgi:hypothetical protein